MQFVDSLVSVEYYISLDPLVKGSHLSQATTASTPPTTAQKFTKGHWAVVLVDSLAVLTGCQWNATKKLVTFTTLYWICNIEW